MDEQPGRFYQMGALERDHAIIELKRRGVSNVKIAKRVGMTEGGVRFALKRIAEEGLGGGRDRR